MISKIAGRVRGVFAGNYPENREDEQFHLNNRGDQCVVQALPERTELVRMGNSYVCIGSAVAPVSSMPSTAAHLSLWNGELDNGMSYVIDAIGSYISTSAGAAINIQLAYQLNLGKITNPAGALAIKSLSGRSNYRGKGNAKASVTVTNDSAWTPVGDSLVCANAANLTLNKHAELFGKLIVPPGGMFSVATLCNAAASAVATPYIIWHEVQLTLG